VGSSLYVSAILSEIQCIDHVQECRSPFSRCCGSGYAYGSRRHRVREKSSFDWDIRVTSTEQTAQLWAGETGRKDDRRNVERTRYGYPRTSS